MKKKILTMLLALVMMVSVIPGASAAGTQPQDDGDSVSRSPNRYYYTTEYTDYLRTVTIAITEEDVKYNQTIKNIMSVGLDKLSEDAPLPISIFSSVLDDLLTLAYNGNPLAREGVYIVKTRYKTKYKIDSLDPTNKVATDIWIQYLFDYLGDNEDPYLKSYRLK